MIRNNNQAKVIGVILLVLFVLGLFAWRAKTSTPAQLSIPLYPGATFIKKEFVPDCPGEPAVCNVESYTWKSNATLAEVIDWYAQDKVKSGWKLTGGAGTEGVNRFGQFSNGTITYWLTIYLLGKSASPVGIEVRGPIKN